MAKWNIDIEDMAKLEMLTRALPEVGEDAINEVLHEEGGLLIHDEIKRLMPVSNVKAWKGKKPHAKYANSLLINAKENLEVTVVTRKDYRYLYFPDDGSSTTKHAGGQGFFIQGAENKAQMIKNLCIARIVEKFNNQAE